MRLKELTYAMKMGLPTMEARGFPSPLSWKAGTM